jgi:hypothetical protein
MTARLHQSVLDMLSADTLPPEVSEASAILITRVNALLYDVVRRAPQAAVMRAAAAHSNATLLQAVADLVVTEATADEDWNTALLRGTVALAACLEAAGGVWTAGEATMHLGVTRQTLQQWRDRGRVLALPRRDGSYAYPVAQFKPPVSDTGAPGPYAAIAQITKVVGSRLRPEELVALLATPQPLLRDEAGAPMTPFTALARGEAARVLALVNWIVTPSDAEAPDIEAAVQTAAAAP